MKKICLCIALCTALFAARAQDLLIKNNGDTITAKITEVLDDAVKYKRLNNPEGPTFVTSKTELSKIIYSNGTEEKIEVKAIQQAPPENQPKPTEPNIDTRSEKNAGAKFPEKSGAGFEPIIMEPYGNYYKGMRLNDSRLLYLYRSYNDKTLLNEYKSAKSLHTVSKITGIVGIPMAVGGVIMAIISFVPTSYDSNNYGDDNYDYGNRGLLGPGIGLFAGFVALEVTSGVLRGSYKSKMRKSMEHYNNLISKHELK